ncbi:hypothetical protein ACXWTF_12095 [Thiomicrolovo sp. ZZH C-3]
MNFIISWSVLIVLSLQTVLAIFNSIKIGSTPGVILYSLILIALIFVGTSFYFVSRSNDEKKADAEKQCDWKSNK